MANKKKLKAGRLSILEPIYIIKTLLSKKAPTNMSSSDLSLSEIDSLLALFDEEFVVVSVPNHKRRPGRRSMMKVKVVPRDSVHRVIHKLAVAHVARKHARLITKGNQYAELRFFYKKFFE